MIIYWVIAGIYCITAMWFQKMLREVSQVEDMRTGTVSGTGVNIGIFIVSLFWFLFVLHDLLFGGKRV